MIAVDAGAHLASIVRILELQMPMNSLKLPPPGHKCILPDGPFAGVPFPNISAKANALWFFRELLHSFLITHPHLDHVSGMGINTPALEYGREAKAIVALPSAIDAIKTHIFNDSIWPNLSDEAHGVGFVTYRRLIEGGNPRLGYGESRGYVNVCDGLATKCWGLSHGHCRRQMHNSPHQRGDSFNNYMHGGSMPPSDGYGFPSRRMSRLSDEHGYASGYPTQLHRDGSMPGGMHPPGPVTPGLPSAVDNTHNLYQPVDSSAFFIRNDITGQEIVIFGDLEPDSVSMYPRNYVVWDDTAPKFVAGILKAIFIECSYDDSVRNEDLYGHLCPRHLIAELTYLAQRVTAVRKYGEAEVSPDLTKTEMHLHEPPSPSTMKRKRKRMNESVSFLPETPEEGTEPHTPNHNRATSNSRRRTIRSPPRNARSPVTHRPHDDGYTSDDPLKRHSSPPSNLRLPQQLSQHVGMARQTSSQTQTQTQMSLQADPRSGSMQIAPPDTSQPPLVRVMGEPLKGLTVHIIHVKDTLADGPSQGDVIGEQLKARCLEVGLGCDFDVTTGGEEIWV